LRQVDIMSQMRNFKGFIFTLDAVFALVVAAAGVSILLYGSMASQGLYASAPSQAYGIMQSMLQTSISSASGSSYIIALAPYSNVSSLSWPQYGHNAQLNSSSGYSLSTPYLLYTYSTVANMIPSAVLGGGFAFVAAGNKVYMINATTGTLKSSFPSGSGANVVGVPAIYKSMLLFANASNYVRGINIYNSVLQWNFSASNSITTPLEIENNYLAFGTANGFYLLNPLNGTEVAFAGTSAPSRAPAYVDGEYLVTTDLTSGQNHIYSYSLFGNTLSSTWNAQLGSLPTTAPSTTYNTVAVGSGSVLYVFTLGGSPISVSPNLGSTVLGVSAYKGTYYVQTVSNLYSFTYMGNAISSAALQSTSQNSIVSASQSVIYAIDGNYFSGYSDNLGRLLWNISLQGNYMPGYSSVALAYGNAYVPSGNVLYVFGTYKPQPNDNMLQTLGNMYLNGQGGYADYILGSVYNSSNVGIFINHNYAPDLSVAAFNGQNGYVDAGDSTALSPEAGATGQMSLCTWYYVNSLIDYNGPIIKGDSIPSNGNGWEYTLDQNGKRQGFTLWNAAGVSIANYSTSSQPNPKSWYFSCFTYNYAASSAYYYLNGKQYTAAFSNSVGTASAGTGHLIIGAGEGGYSNVIVSDLQLYNITLSSQQIGQMYESGAFATPVTTQGLKALASA
jgi:hypothetical protein